MIPPMPLRRSYLDKTKGTELFGAHLTRLIARFTVLNPPAGDLFNLVDKVIASCQLTSLGSLAD